MLLVLIRITAVIIGALFFLPAFPMAFLGFRENLWLLPIGALSGFFGAWLICAGWSPHPAPPKAAVQLPITYFAPSASASDGYTLSIAEKPDISNTSRTDWFRPNIRSVPPEARSCLAAPSNTRNPALLM